MNKKTILNSALHYLETMSWSVIPVSQDKKPIIQWEKYQKERATREEVIEWFGEKKAAMVGIVTGKISNLVVIDVDSKDDVETLMEFEEEECIVNTPRGYHIYFEYMDGLTNRTNLREHVDIRAEGGYVVAPPSVNEDGKKYIWHLAEELTPDVVGVLPEEWYKEMRDYSTAPKPVVKDTKAVGAFKEGRRDDDIFNLAYTLFRGGKTKAEVRPIVLAMAATCTPPFPEADAIQKIRSAEKRINSKDRNLMQDARDWIGLSTGSFHRNALVKDLGIHTQEDKNNFRVILSRLQEEKLIEPYSRKDGVFMKVSHDYCKQDFKRASTEKLDIEYPFGIHEFFKTMPRNIIVVAGVPDGGKSAFFYNTLRMNEDKWDCHLLNTDCGPEELHERLIKFDDKELLGDDARGLDEWRFTPWEVPDGGYAELIEKEGLKDSLVIVDFLELGENFYMVGAEMDKILEKMDKGVALIGLQKSFGKEFGRGGDIGMARPRLYITIEGGVCKILKCKNRNPGYGSYNGKLITFKLVQGAKFIPQGVWRSPGSDPHEKFAFKF